MVFERADATSEKRVKGNVGSGIKLLVLQHTLTFQNTLLKFEKFLTNRALPEKFKLSPFLPVRRSLMFLLPTTIILSCKRWSANCITVKFALALFDHIVE